MLENVLKTIEDEHLIQPRDRVLVAVSGGVDSVVLLDVLSRLSQELEFSIAVAHFDHRMRADSHLDSEFVANLARELGFQFHAGSADVPRFAKSQKRSPEDAARVSRYKFLVETAAVEHYTRIALGHHLDDQVETFLLNLLRGSGLAGLMGMSHCRSQDGIDLIRPLLNFSRYEIEQYAREQNLPYREDPTNQDQAHTRNRVRAELVPLLRTFNPKAAEAIAQTSKLLSDAHQIITEQVKSAYEAVLISERPDEIQLNRPDFAKLADSLKKYVLRAAIAILKGNLNEIEAVHIERAIADIERNYSGTHVPIVGELHLLIDSGEIVVRRGQSEKVALNEACMSLDMNSSEPQMNEALGWTFELRIGGESDEISTDPLEATFDFDKIDGSLIVRNRKDGDRISPLGMGGRKKIQDLFVDAKIPQRERDRIPLICDDSEILWVVGIRMSDRIQVTPSTKRVLRIKAFKTVEE